MDIALATEARAMYAHLPFICQADKLKQKNGSLTVE